MNGTRWWGRFELPLAATGRWKIGPLTFWAGRAPQEWRVAFERTTDWLDSVVDVVVPAPADDTPPKDAERERFGFDATTETLTVQPRLADRPVVTRPEAPFSIAAGRRVSLFVSSPLWVRLGTGAEDEMLVELPTVRASDTWFGTNVSGFLCYASRTSLRLQLDEVPVRPHRAVTPVVIDNQAEDALRLERLSLPVPNLSVYLSGSGLFWTERIRLTREESGEVARVRIEEGGPAEAAGATRLSEPRKFAGSSFASRVFGGLFG